MLLFNFYSLSFESLSLISVVFLQINSRINRNSYKILAITFPKTSIIINAKKLNEINANDPNVTNKATIKYNTLNKFSASNFLKDKKSYIHPQNPVNLPSFFFDKNVKYNTMPPTTAKMKATINQILLPIA